MGLAQRVLAFGDLALVAGLGGGQRLSRQVDQGAEQVVGGHLTRSGQVADIRVTGLGVTAHRRCREHRGG